MVLCLVNSARTAVREGQANDGQGLAGSRGYWVAFLQVQREEARSPPVCEPSYSTGRSSPGYCHMLLVSSSFPVYVFFGNVHMILE